MLTSFCVRTSSVIVLEMLEEFPYLSVMKYYQVYQGYLDDPYLITWSWSATFVKILSSNSHTHTHTQMQMQNNYANSLAAARWSHISRHYEPCK